MLLIDGVKYEEWTPPNEDEFEREVGKHAEEIFGKDAKYFDLKHKLASRSGTGSIPDGYVITLGNKPEVQIIEFELASHTQQHVVNQVVNIISGIENATAQQKICNAIEDEINQDEIFVARIVKAIKPFAIHRFLSDSFSNTLPTINIIIDKSWPALEEAISKITPPPRIIEFQTFTREGIGLAVHAHLFEPLYKETATVKNVLTSANKGEDTDGLLLFFRVENFWIKYKRLRIPTEYLKDLSLSHDTSFELETDVGIIKTKIDRWNQICIGMGKWYKAHPELKAGAAVEFQVLEPMKRYRLGREKRSLS